MSRSEEWILGDIDEPDRARRRTRIEPKKQTRLPAKKKRGGTMGRLFLFFTWFVFFFAGAAGSVLLAAGLVRDSTYGDSRATVDLSRNRSSRTLEFIPWVPGRYFLYLETLDRTDRQEEVSFRGRLEMIVVKPDGNAVIAEPFEPPTLDHRLNGGTEWTKLRDFYVAVPSFQPWRASVTVQEGDAAFGDVRSALLVLRDRHPPGIEGLMNYALAWPAIGLFALAFLTAVALSRRGGTWIPALLSLLGLCATGWLFSLV